MNSNPDITTSGQLKFTQSEIDYLRQFLTANDRGGYYLALYNMTGVTQVLVQGEISTFSESGGGAAYVSNMLMYKFEPDYKIKLKAYLDDPTNGYLGRSVTLDTFSNIIAKTDLDNMDLYRKDNNRDNKYPLENDSTGYFDNGLMLEKAFVAWEKVGLLDYFPGQSLAAAEYATLYVNDVIEKINQQYEGAIPSKLEALKSFIQVYVNEFQNQAFDAEKLLNALKATGTFYAGLGVVLGSRFVSKRLSDFEDREGYKIVDLPDAKYKVVIDINTGFVAGMFRDEFVPDTLPSVLTTVAEYWPEVVGLLTGELSGVLNATIFAEILENIGKLYKESVMFQPGEYSGMPTKWDDLLSQHAELGTEKNETLWGTGGENNAAIADVIHGGGGDDRIFSGDGEDQIYGDAGDDLLYGQKGADSLYGGDGKDTLRGGQGNDHLYGGMNDDYLDGGDITDAESGDDFLIGGKGKDVLVGASGSDFLYGDNESAGSEQDDGDDELYGGDGVDYLTGGGGNDYLDGGKGEDHYYFNTNYGYDIIEDQDGKGKIIINGNLLKVGEKQNDVLWLSEDRKYYITIKPDFDGVLETKRLVITSTNPEDENTIIVKNWKNNDLGILLTDVEPSQDSPIINGVGTDGDDYITDSIYYLRGNSSFLNSTENDSNYIYNPLTDMFTIKSYKGNDSIILDDKNYIVTLGEGEVKKVIAGNGHTIVHGNNAIDQIFTGSGKDTIFLEAETSYVYHNRPEGISVNYDNGKNTQKLYNDKFNFASTGAGNDTIIGGITKDIVYAGNDKDFIAGDGGNDEIYGENGNDIIYGDNHIRLSILTKQFRAEANSTNPDLDKLDLDRIIDPYIIDTHFRKINTNFGYHGVDRLYGGSGDDIILGQGGADYLFGGENNDTLSGDYVSVNYVRYYDGVSIGEDGLLTVTQDESDLIIKTINRYRYEFSGEDYLDGGVGNDQLLGGLKNDQLYGGEGDDWIYGDSDLNQEFSVQTYEDAMYDSIFNYEWQIQFANDERFTKIYPQFVDENNTPLWTANDYVEGGKGKDHIFTEEGNDIAYGGADDDVIYGDWSEFGGVEDKYHGNDILHGDDGKDTIYGDGGDDQIFGENDNDVLYGDGKNQEGKWHGKDKLFGGNGDDQILGQGGDDEIDGGDGKEYINGDDDKLDGQWHGKDKIWGGNGQDHIIGNGNADIIYGGTGNDKIYGDSDTLDKVWHGDDELYGDSGNDIIYAGSGNDKLTGGLDHDELYGGDGNDEYYFKKGHGQDVIFENDGDDKIYFEDVSSDEVIYLRMADSLIITGYNQHDLITIANYYKEEDKKIERIIFQDKEVNINLIVNTPNKVLDLPYDESTGQSYAIFEKKINNESFEITDIEKTLYIIKGSNNLFQINNSENIVLVGNGDRSNNYYGHNSNNLKVIGGNGNDNYKFTGSMNVIIDDENYTGIIEMSTLSNYFEWRYDISCYGWFVRKSPAEMDLVSSGQFEDHYQINEKSTRLNEVIYDASSGKLLIQNNTSTYVNAKGPGESQTLPVVPDIIPYEKKDQANIFIENLFSRSDVDTALSNMKIYLGGYSYTIAGEKTVVIDAGTLSLGDYINQGNVKAYYTDGDDLITGLTDKVRSQNFSDRLENYFETVYAGAGNDQINLGLGSSIIYAESGNDYIIAPDISQVDVVYGGDGNDIIYNFNALNGNQGNTSNNSSAVDLIYAGEGDDTVFINYQYAEVYGGAGNDKLYAGDHGAFLNGGVGLDHLVGGLGDDTFVVDELDIYEENDPNGGYDTIIALSSIDLIQTNFEAVTLLGEQNFNIYGNAANNRLIGNEGNNHIDGRTGSDYMAGQVGDDYYVVDTTDTVATDDDGNTYILEGDQVVEDFDGGIDTIERWQDARFISQDANGNPVVTNNHRLLEDNIENLILKGNAKTAFGNDLDNIIVGNSQDNYIDGLAGNDTYVFVKGGGTDTYSFEDSIDAVNILKIQGYSTNEVSAQKYGNSIYLSFKGTNDHIWLSNYYVADTVDTTYRMDQIIFDSGTTWTSTDIDALVNRTLSNHAPTVNAAIPMITSNQGTVFSYKFASNVIIDQDSWDSLSYKITLTTKDSSGQYQSIPSWLSFDAATQTLSGTPPSNVTGNLSFFYWGTDMYGLGTGTSFTLKVNPPNQAPTVLNAIADQTMIDAKAFSYTVPSTTFKDPDGDALTYTATLEDGSPLPSWLSFNATTRVLSGTSPDNAAALTIKIIVKDTVNQSVSDVFKLTFVVQNQTINGTSSADTLYGASGNDTITGQAGNDILYGQSGNDTLNGGTGNDTMYGGKGDDTYIIDSATDIVSENANEGLDTVQSSITYTLGNEVENLTLTGTAAINATGNALNNTLIGNSAVNSLTGGAGDDYLDGGTGADKLFGGTGNDTYVVDNTSDVVTENINEGVDTVLSSVTLTLGSNLENLTLTGTTAINGTGNALNNTIIGNSAVNTLTGAAGDDYLDGGVGADKLLGGIGNDSYVIDNTGDVITENVNEGIDTVLSSITYTLGSNFEHLTLMGSAAINATGNTLNNTLTGNSGVNILNGGAGNDILDGQGGNDQFTGGTGADTLLYQLLVATDALGGNGSDSWSDFTIGNTTTNVNADKIDISDLLLNYTGNASAASLDPFLKTVISGSNTQLYIDRDGSGSTYSSSLLLTLNNTNTNLNDLINNQQLVI